ncbi:hypothetical protein BN946_scf184866.g34 [Trametes cinnabarina]|uniref:Uncharacterized protein n=1 Tax=Pycnoporus cinnabarinus TaxID=5643 RepID=A0A060SRV7_PYCCI|nr:hypothetical protein BN946_scf184866.g34 [Trametes cinnabarina]
MSLFAASTSRSARSTSSRTPAILYTTLRRTHPNRGARYPSVVQVTASRCSSSTTSTIPPPPPKDWRLSSALREKPYKLISHPEDWKRWLDEDIHVVVGSKTARLPRPLSDETGHEPPPQRYLPTLSPRMFKDSDLVDLSNTYYQMDMAADGIRGNLANVFYSRDFRNLYGRPFPPGTRGFFYWKSYYGHPKMSGEIRFRIMPDASKKSFAYGRDLLGPDDFAWRLPGLVILHRWPPLIEQLKEEGHLSERDITPFARQFRMIRKSIYGNLPGLGDPVMSASRTSLTSPSFVYDFSVRKPVQAWYIREERLNRIFISNLTKTHHSVITPIQGSGIFTMQRRFERVADGSEKVRWSLRCEKIFEPMLYPSIAMVKATCAVWKVSPQHVPTVIVKEGDVLRANGQEVYYEFTPKSGRDA